MESYESDWTLVVPYMDGFALSLDQSESELLKTPKGSIVFHHNEDFIKHIQSELEEFITISTENGALLEEYLGSVNSYSLYAGLKDFSLDNTQYTVEQVTNELMGDPILHPNAGPEIAEQYRAWRPVFDWLNKEGIVSNNEKGVFFGGIIQVHENVFEFASSVSAESYAEEEEVTNIFQNVTGKTSLVSQSINDSDDEVTLTFHEFSLRIHEEWNRLSGPKQVVLNVLVTLFRSPLSALSYINGGCSANQFSKSIMEGKLFLDSSLAEPIEDQNRNMLNEIKGVAHSCIEFLGFIDEPDEIFKLVELGESKTLEFKQTLSLDVKKQTKEKYIEDSALKTIVGFLNSDGGTLLIGIKDDGVCAGISFEKNKFYKDNTDKLLRHLRNMIKTRIGEENYTYIKYNIADYRGKEILKVDCGVSSTPCYLDDKEFYVRINPATDRLEGPVMVEYVRNHFK